MALAGVWLESGTRPFSLRQPVLPLVSPHYVACFAGNPLSMTNWPNFVFRTGPAIEQQCPEQLHPMGLVRKRQSKAWAGFAAAIIALGPAACRVGPDYLRPSAPEPVAYKELKGWKRATPRDESDRGPWWSVFQDTKLNSFEPQVEISNQTVAADDAAYRQTLAVIKEAQAGLFPAVTVNYSYIGSHFGAEAIGNALGTGTTKTVSTLAVQWQLGSRFLGQNPPHGGKQCRRRPSLRRRSRQCQAFSPGACSPPPITICARRMRCRFFSIARSCITRRRWTITQHQYDAGTVSIGRRRDRAGAGLNDSSLRRSMSASCGRSSNMRSRS